jgi:hypothetical protein
MRRVAVLPRLDFLLPAHIFPSAHSTTPWAVVHLMGWYSSPSRTAHGTCCRLKTSLWLQSLTKSCSSSIPARAEAAPSALHAMPRRFLRCVPTLCKLLRGPRAFAGPRCPAAVLHVGVAPHTLARGFCAPLLTRAGIPCSCPQKAGIVVVEMHTERAGHAFDIAAGLDPAATGAVVLVGGDGTLHECMNGLACGALARYAADPAHAPVRLPPLGILPCGTGNNVALALRLRTVERSLQCLVEGRMRRIDVIELTAPDEADVPSLLHVSRQADAGAGAVSGSEATGAAVHTSAPPLTLEQLRRRVLFSPNVVVWALGSAVTRTADSLRWMGCGSQYTVGAYVEIAKSHKWVAAVEYVDPPQPVVITQAELDAGAEALALPGRSKPGHESAGTNLSAGSAAAPVAQDGCASAAAAIPPLPEEPTPYMIVSVHPNTYFSANTPFAPLSRADDGLMDLVAVVSASRVNMVKGLKAAEAGGRHVLGGGASGEPVAHAMDFIRYSRAREIVLTPLDDAATAAYKDGANVVVPRHGAGRRPSYGQPQPVLLAAAGDNLPGGTSVGGATGGDAAAAGQPLDDAAAVAARRAERARMNLAPTAMSGPRSVNVDGELAGFSPVRVRVLQRAIAVFC